MADPIDGLKSWANPVNRPPRDTSVQVDKDRQMKSQRELESPLRGLLRPDPGNLMGQTEAITEATNPQPFNPLLTYQGNPLIFNSSWPGSDFVKALNEAYPHYQGTGPIKPISIEELMSQKSYQDTMVKK